MRIYSSISMDCFTVINYKLLLLSIFIFVQFIITSGSNAEMPIETSTTTFQPIGPTEYLNMFKTAGSHMHDAARRRLAPFQVCSQCRCCSGNTCKTMPCCFFINCNIPNKPYGYCAFQPKKCDCKSCATA